jgi:hypothetical protein
MPSWTACVGFSARSCAGVCTDPDTDTNADTHTNTHKHRYRHCQSLCFAMREDKERNLLRDFFKKREICFKPRDQKERNLLKVITADRRLLNGWLEEYQSFVVGREEKGVGKDEEDKARHQEATRALEARASRAREQIWIWRSLTRLSFRYILLSCFFVFYCFLLSLARVLFMRFSSSIFPHRLHVLCMRLLPPSLPLSLKHTHARTHARMHACTHTRAHTHTNARTLACTLARVAQVGAGGKAVHDEYVDVSDAKPSPAGYQMRA